MRLTDSTPIENVLDAALFFARQGIRVFPVISGGKAPALGKQSPWQQTATTDENEITRWWMMTYRGNNLGVVADKLVVLDVDTIDHGKGGKDGLATLQALIEEHGPIPATFTVRTASGGYHFYFINDTEESFTKGADKLGPGLDVQTGNAYLVGPHSKVGSGVYEITTNVPFAPLPAWMVELIKDRHIERPAPRRTIDAPVNDRYILAAVQGEIDRLDECARLGWSGPAWDETTFQVACNLIEIANSPDANYSHAAAYSDFMSHAPADAKFNTKQHETKWRSATRKVGATGRVFPEARRANDSHHAIAAPPAPPEPPKRVVHTTPDDFFGKHGFLVEKMAGIVCEGFALGPDLELWLYHEGIFRPEPMELMRRVTQRLGDRYRPGSFNATKDFVSALPDLRQLSADQPDSRFIILANGVYVWQSDTLRPHSEEYGAITQLPVVYDAEATCPAFDKYLSEVVPADTIQLVWEVIGYLLMFGNPLQKSVILQGPGGNGKSTFLRVLQHLIGRENISALSLRQMTEDRFALAGLLGKTANLAGDIDSKYLGDSSRFKQVVGGDLIEVERKFGQPFSFEPYAVPVFSANEFWKTGDTTHGYWRRWLPIPFPYPVTEKAKKGELDPLDESVLFAETAGIFNRAMIGLRTLMARGSFEMSQSVEALFGVMEASADILNDWFMEDVSIIFNNPNETDVRSNRTAVYNAFKKWCLESGHKGMSSTNFYKRMGQLGYAEVKVHGERHLRGIELAMHAQPALQGAN